MSSPRLVLAAVLVTGCASGLRYQAVGSGRVVTAGAGAVGPGADPNAGLAAAVALPAELPHSTYKVRYEVWLPRAVEVDWTLTCGSATQSGQFGETFEAYRERRLVELRRQREEAQRQAAAVGAAVGQAVLGTTTATVAATAPGASAEATATVDGAAIGATVGAATVSTDVELAPGDVGASLHRGGTTIVVPDGGASACALEVAPREPGVLATGQFHVSRQDDSAQRTQVEHARIAVAVRADLRGQLLTRGADPEARVRHAAALRAQAEAAAAARAQALAIAARAQAEAGFAVVQASGRARIQLAATLEARGADRGYRARIDGICRGTRTTLRDRLIAHGADPELRIRLVAAADAERARRLQLADAERARLALLAQRRRELAIAVRGELSAQLVARGGAVKTMMPAPIDEQPGAPPLPGYAWSPGHWEWRGGQWRWVYGYWLGSTAVSATASSTTTTTTSTTTVTVPTPPTGVTIGVGVGVTIGAGATTPRPQSQDHRR